MGPLVEAERRRDAIRRGWAGPSPVLVLLLCAGVIWTLGILIGNILPVVLELLREARRLTESQLGSIGSAYVLGHGLVVASAPFWVGRVSPMKVSASGLLASAAGLLVVALLSSVPAMTGGLLLVGAATGLASAPAFAILGATPDPTRVYSLALFGSTLVATLVSFALPHGGLQAGLIGAVALFVFAAPCVLALAGTRVAQAAAVTDGARPRASKVVLWPPILAMAAGAVFLGVSWGGIYNFVGVIGAANGVDVRGGGWLVAVGLFGALVGSILPALIGARMRPAFMLSLLMAIVVATYPAMQAHSSGAFVAAFAIQLALTTAAFAYLLGVVRSIDLTERAYIAFPAVQALGAAGGTKFTGWLLTSWTTGSFFWIAAAAVVASWIALMAALRLHDRINKITHVA